MPDVINVQDLTEEQVEALQKIIELFRKQGRKSKPGEKTEEEEYLFAERSSDVIGKLTREEIYEEL